MKIKLNFKFVLVLIILTSFIFTSCEISPRSSALYGDYHVGTKGVSLEFLSQAPPDEVYDEEDFQVQTFIRNEGAYSLNNSAVKIDFIKDEFNFETKQTYSNNLYQQIQGKSNSFPEGERSDFIVALLKAKKMYANFEAAYSNLFLKICYPYRTEFAEQVCVDTDIGGRSLRTQICHAEELKYSEGQGAPVAVVSVLPKMLPIDNYVEPQYTITIKNVGSGIVLEPKREIYEGLNQPEVCANNLQPNKVKINAKLQNEDLVCFPEIIPLVGGVGTATCRFEDNTILMTKSSYYTVLEVNLDYNYEESYSKKVKIVRKDDLTYANSQIQAKKCQSWEVLVGDVCENRCEFCAKNPGSSECTIYDVDLDKTKERELHSCIYHTYDDCDNANKEVISKNLENNCILRDNLCPPSTYCGVPRCLISEANNKIPEIKILEYPTHRFVQWHVSDENNEPTSRYSDSLGTCGIKTENGKYVSYYKFISDEESCLTDGYTEIATTYESDIYPPFFSVEIPGEPKYVCIKAIDNQKRQVVSKYSIEMLEYETRIRKLS
ncbi:MAG: hypothetical protein AB7V77_03235 [Candidatus Woesearchaeota archaeon]